MIDVESTLAHSAILHDHFRTVAQTPLECRLFLSACAEKDSAPPARLLVDRLHGRSALHGRADDPARSTDENRDRQRPAAGLSRRCRRHVRMEERLGDAANDEAAEAELVSDHLLGEGATAQVWFQEFSASRCSWRPSRCFKEPRRRRLGWIREEMAIHTSLHHSHICKMYTGWEGGSTFTMVLQLCRGGSLCDTMGRALDDGAPLEEAFVRATFCQLLGALEHCHSHGVVHRDLKLDNLCWLDDEESHLLLLDFGYASTRDTHTAFSGSAHYAAPEVHRTCEAGTVPPAPFSASKADVWSAGVCLFAMLATSLPFNGPEETDEQRAALRQKIYAGVPDAPSGGPASRGARRPRLPSSSACCRSKPPTVRHLRKSSRTSGSVGCHTCRGRVRVRASSRKWLCRCGAPMVTVVSAPHDVTTTSVSVSSSHTRRVLDFHTACIGTVHRPRRDSGQHAGKVIVKI